MKSIIVILVIVYTSFSLWAKPQKVYIVGVEGIPYLPYSEVKDGKYYGALYDVVSDFAKREGLNFKFIPLPIKRLFADFYGERIDFKLPSNEYWQADLKKTKNLKISYSKPILGYIDGVISAKDIKNQNELKVLGTVAGFTPWEYLGRIKGKKIALKENPNVKGLLQQGLMKRIDGVYINVAVGKHYLKNELKKADQLKFIKKLPHTKSAYQMATTKHPEIIKKFNEYLDREKKNILKIQKKINESYK